MAIDSACPKCNAPVPVPRPASCPHCNGALDGSSGGGQAKGFFAENWVWIVAPVVVAVVLVIVLAIVFANDDTSQFVYKLW